MSLKSITLSGACLILTACASVAESTNSLTDDKIRSETAGALGYAPSDLTITSRRTEGTNTYVTLKSSDGKEFACTVNGGNLLSMGIVNPPLCNKKGEPANANPFQR